MDWSIILSYVATLGSWVPNLLMILGTIVVIGTGIDKMTKDKGAFAAKVLAVPILGSLLSGLSKFSPFNYNESN